MLQDFSGQNLRGRSFKGQNLVGANFSGADIRSADFTGANLTDANFSHAKAGLQKSWIVTLILFGLLVSILSTSMSVFGSTPTKVSVFTILSESHTNTRYLTLLGQSGVLFILTIGWGFQIALEAGAIIPVITWSLTKILAIFRIIPSNEAVVAIQSGILGGAVIGTWLLAIAGVMAINVSILIVIVRINNHLINLILAGAVTIIIAIIGIFSVAGCNLKAFTTSGSGVIVATCIAVYVSWRILLKDKKFAWILRLAINIVSTRGTSFRNANLTSANFNQAIINSTDLRNAIIKQTCWLKAQGLDYARIGNSYLKHSQIQELVVNQQGKDKKFNSLNLAGINLSNVDLTDASFIRANLNHANLQNAILYRTKLVQTQLDGTDFTGATLTGAYIQDWGITSDTLFDGVRCEYVYMRLPTKENPDPFRKPDNRQEVFADGEFGDFIKPIFDTLDLYHSQGVDPRAIAISFKQLAENHPDAELEIVAMEKRGEDKFLLRAKSAVSADKSELNAEYFDTYNEIKALPEQEIKLLLAEKDSRIRSLEIFVNQALQRPSFYSSTQIQEVGSMNSNQGGINQSANNSQFGQGQQAAQGDASQQSMSNNENYKTKYDQRNANIGGFVDTAQSGSQQTFNQNISAPEQKQNLAEAAAEIQQLLEQLSQSYPTNTMSGKMALATEAIQQIENNPTLMQKTISALSAGGTAALDQLLSHPAASFVIAALDNWNMNSQ
ncbi:pentapeptide repeat-containing protein [Nostoc sp. FACHB-888]|uniref:pentapeptide repeat-containing protein n=1 Tax=Nostoc sp. FACHB-888 TaxID=2692842 RepID=UPI001681DB6B|nr:pentapeptide repeat-containing protein [Nostoc sp. FACHB-888]MBD2249082.1 pentapeptide repeat-containing protein [Nostoc sp. FACHB-888]